MSGYAKTGNIARDSLIDCIIEDLDNWSDYEDDDLPSDLDD